MSTHRQITAFRRPITFSYIYDPYRGVGIGRNLMDLATAIRTTLEANETWSDLERAIEATLHVYTPRNGGGWGSESFENHRADNAITKGAKFDARLAMDETINLVPKTGVTLTIKQGWIDRAKTPIITLAFENPIEGATVKDRLDKITQLSIENVEWEEALYLKPWTSDHWVFSAGSEARLGERLTRVYKKGGYFREQGDLDYHRIAPLPGETFTVYQSQAASQLGLSISPTERTRHPEMMVFASVGPLSLSFKARDPFDRKSHDRISVFADDRLPIAPPEPEEDSYRAEADNGDLLPFGWDPDED